MKGVEAIADPEAIGSPVSTSYSKSKRWQKA